MSEYSRATVVSVVEKLHVCLAKAIDAALTNRVGANWFEQFKAAEAAEEKPIVTSKNTSALSMDLQACLKILRMRETMAKIVFEYYGHNFFGDNEDAKTAKLILNQRLNNLIHNIRNDIYAHAGADMVETGEGGSLRHSVYGTKEAVDDMIKTAFFFKTITDSSGVSYYDMMLKATRVSKKYSVSETVTKENMGIPTGVFVEICNAVRLKIETDEAGNMSFLSENYEGDVAKIKLYISQNFSNSRWYTVSEVIEKESMKVDEGKVVVACQSLSIPVSTDINGNLVFSSSNYSGDVARIKLAIGGKAVAGNSKKTVWIVLAVLALLVVGIVVFVVALGGNDRGREKSKDSKTASVVTTTQAQKEEVTDNNTAVNGEVEPSETQPVVTEPVTVETKPVSKKPLKERTIQGEGSFEEMYFTVDQLHSGKIYLNYENKTQDRTTYAFGFAMSEIQFYLETASGKELNCVLTSRNNSDIVSKKVAPGEMGKIYLDFKNVDEEIVKISFICVVKTPYGSQLPTNAHSPGEIEISIEYID